MDCILFIDCVSCLAASVIFAVTEDNNTICVRDFKDLANVFIISLREYRCVEKLLSIVSKDLSPSEFPPPPPSSSSSHESSNIGFWFLIFIFSTGLLVGVGMTFFIQRINSLRRREVAQSYENPSLFSRFVNRVMHRHHTRGVWTNVLNTSPSITIQLEQLFDNKVTVSRGKRRDCCSTLLQRGEETAKFDRQQGDSVLNMTSETSLSLKELASSSSSVQQQRASDIPPNLVDDDANASSLPEQMSPRSRPMPELFFESKKKSKKIK